MCTLGDCSYNTDPDNDEESDISTNSSQRAAQHNGSDNGSDDGSDDEDAELWDSLLEVYQQEIEDLATLMTSEFWIPCSAHLVT